MTELKPTEAEANAIFVRMAEEIGTNIPEDAALIALNLVLNERKRCADIASNLLYDSSADEALTARVHGLRIAAKIEEGPQEEKLAPRRTDNHDLEYSI